MSAIVRWDFFFGCSCIYIGDTCSREKHELVARLL